MTNDMIGGIALGFGLCLAFLATLQIGINMGIRTCSDMLDGQYPAAMNWLNKHKSPAKILPYVISEKVE